MNDDTVFFAQRNGVLTITLKDKEGHNRISDPVILQILRTLEIAAKDDDIGAIVLTAADPVFSISWDILASDPPENLGGPLLFEEKVEHQKKRHALPLVLHTIPKITIAAVNGPVSGAALGLVLSCDLRFAKKGATFAATHSNLALSGDFGVSWQLTRMVGEAKAKEMLINPDSISANKALELGLLNDIFPKFEFDRKVTHIAEAIANGPLISHSWVKEVVNEASETDFETSLEKEAIAQMRCTETLDFHEAIRAYDAGEEPSFTGQ